ncbi:relaxase/mobilization nuclease domain-containing protein [Pelomonas cellulosilytica]|uniref:Conjugal transfer protein TraS n=1 Tax=Pelomonas cellulosilytica TaxID=2906762 RepID=A0ABS8XRW6_9BURK|nr:conjugal transfer protein TraS [Pelomonas sp. P8]MCE4555461.1 conjugal transfer protein TraS [Pelomonas sp. P8]
MGRDIDGLLVQWGDRLFYPGNRIEPTDPTPRLKARAAAIRRHISAQIRRAPQVIVRVAGGGRGMGAIADHLRYITKSGALEFEDDRGTVRDGKEALRDLMNGWRHGSRFIAEVEKLREAVNIMLAMPSGTDPEAVRDAAREFAKIELAGHRYVMVLHRHQTSPHVHLCVKRESIAGQRLSCGRPDLKRWRATFAERLRSRGVEAEATSQIARGATRNFDSLWRLKAKDEGRLKTSIRPVKTGPVCERARDEAMACWGQILKALAASELESDRELAPLVADFLCRTPYIHDVLRRHPEALPEARKRLEAHPQRVAALDRAGPEWGR